MISLRNTLSRELWGSPITKIHKQGATLSVTEIIRKTSDQFYANVVEFDDPMWFAVADWV